MAVRRANHYTKQVLRIAENEHITLRGKNLGITQTFKYLGIMLQTSGSSYRIHVKEKASAVKHATHYTKQAVILAIICLIFKKPHIKIHI